MDNANLDQSTCTACCEAWTTHEFQRASGAQSDFRSSTNDSILDLNLCTIRSEAWTTQQKVWRASGAQIFAASQPQCVTLFSICLHIQQVGSMNDKRFGGASGAQTCAISKSRWMTLYETLIWVHAQQFEKHETHQNIGELPASTLVLLLNLNVSL